jgi:hypothetical protein
VLQLDHLELSDRFTDAAALTAPSVELALPQYDDPVSDAVLQRLELGGQPRMQQRRNAVRLGVVQRPVQQQVRIGAQQRLAALFAGDRIMSTQPDLQRAGRESVGSDRSVLDNEARHRTVRDAAVLRERIHAGGADDVSVADALQRVADGMSDPAGLHTPLPPLESASHGAHGTPILA